MSLFVDAILNRIAWEAFSKSVAFYAGEINDFALRLYIKNELKKLDASASVSENEIDEISEVIEATIVDTPQDIKEIESKEEQKEAFEKYFKKVIINSFKNNKNSQIKVKGAEKYIKDSFSDNKNSQIEV